MVLMSMQFVFKNNDASIVGSVLFGGAVDNCKLIDFNDLGSYSSGEVFDMLVHNSDTDYNMTSSIFSDPLQICQCINNPPDCKENRYKFPYTVYPGETVQVSVAAVGQTRKWNTF